MKTSLKIFAVAVTVMVLSTTLSSCHRHACPTYSKASTSASVRSI